MLESPLYCRPSLLHIFSTEIQLLSSHHRNSLRIRQGPTSHLEACWPCPNKVRKAKQTVYIMSLAKHHSLRYEHMIEIGLNRKPQVKRKWPSNNKLIHIRLRHKATSCKRSSSRNKKDSSSSSGHHPKSLSTVPICINLCNTQLNLVGVRLGNVQADITTL